MLVLQHILVSITGNLSLSQAHVASRYLAEKYGLLPSNDDDKAHAEQVNLTCHDYIAEGNIGH